MTFTNPGLSIFSPLSTSGFALALEHIDVQEVRAAWHFCGWERAPTNAPAKIMDSGILIMGLRDMQVWAFAICRLFQFVIYRQIVDIDSFDIWCLHTSSTWRPGDKKVAVRAITDSEARRPCKLLSGSRVTAPGQPGQRSYPCEYMH